MMLSKIPSLVVACWITASTTLAAATKVYTTYQRLPTFSPLSYLTGAAGSLFEWVTAPKDDPLCPDEPAAQALAQAALGAMLKAHSPGDHGGFRKFTAGPVDDEIYYGHHAGQMVVYFRGTHSGAQWVDNVKCGVGCASHKSVANTVNNELPHEFKDNNVIVVAFSRGNFFASAYAYLFPNNMGAFCSIASPGHQRDPTKGGWVAKIESRSDPVSMLTTPFESFHFNKALLSPIHKVSSYWKGVLDWSNKNVFTNSEIALALDCKKF